MKRWKAILEEYNYELKYLTGPSNYVADALSRIRNEVPAQCQSEQSSNLFTTQLITNANNIQIVSTPINAFKNQIILSIGEADSYELV